MGISFLAPLFLLGLAAVAIPVLIHLRHRERKQAVRFPSLMFVRRIPYRTARRQRIRNWLLFVMRAAAVCLLALAFARPWRKEGTEAAASFARARELVVLLDRSHSMSYGDRWGRALDAARNALGGLGPDDHATLVAFAERADALTPPSADRSALLARLGELEVGSGVTRYGPALQLASELVARSELPSAEVLLISDLQASGWDPGNAVRLPAGTRLNIVDLAEPGSSNLAISGASLSRARRSGREEVTVSAGLANFGPQARQGVVVRLELDGERLQAREVDVPPDGTAMVTFDPIALPGRPLIGRLQAGDDPLPGDNVFHFVLDPEPPLSVLIVEPDNADADHSLFLQRALAVGRQPGFDIRTRRSRRLSADDLENLSVVILNDAPLPGGAVGRRLAEFVRAGGGLFVALGRRSPPRGWPSSAPDLLPAALGDLEDRATVGGSTLGYLDYDHPALELFRAPRSGDFSSARFYRYRRIEDGPAVHALARFDDGTPALVEGSYGDGRVLLWASGLENYWNDLVVQPVFLPFAHQLLKYLSGYRPANAWFRVGQTLDLSQNPALADRVMGDEVELVVEDPSGDDRVLRPARDSWFLGLTEQGIYRVRKLGDDGAGVSIAANLDPAESDLTPVDLQELAGASVAQGEAAGAAAGTPFLSAEQRERRQGLWWYLLVGVGALLLLETLMSNRSGRSLASS